MKQLQNASRDEITVTKSEFLEEDDKLGTYKSGVYQTVEWNGYEIEIETDWKYGIVHISEPIDQTFDLEEFLDLYDNLSYVLTKNEPTDYTSPKEQIEQLDEEHNFDVDEIEFSNLEEPKAIPMDQDDIYYNKNESYFLWNL